MVVDSIFAGRPTDDRQEGSKSAKGLIDELEFWFAHRDHLKAFDLIKDGRVPLLLTSCALPHCFNKSGMFGAVKIRFSIYFNLLFKLYSFFTFCLFNFLLLYCFNNVS